MNFLEKIKMENSEGILGFLSKYGFTIDKCHWDCCKGYNKIITSDEGLYYNHITVWLEGEFIKFSWHQEYNFGGGNVFNEDSVLLTEATEECILQTINDLLPKNLD